jgi:hypothetical protein
MEFIGGVAFCLTNMNISNFEEFDLLHDDFTFRRARENEILQYKEKLSKYPTITHEVFGEIDYIYEYSWKAILNGDSTIYEKCPLEKKDYKYWIVAYKKTNHALHELEIAISLLKNSFEISLWSIRQNKSPDKHSFIHNEYSINKFRDMITSYYNYQTLNVNMDEIKSIPRIYAQYINNHNKYDFIEHAFKNYTILKYIDNQSDLLVLGYFSIIEMLITHPPRQNENLDSITHQIVTKLNLLEKFFERKIIYFDYFDKQVKEETIWKKLYSYRSSIAHGNIINFEKDFNVLRSKEITNKFILEIIKNLLLLSLDKPDFINDLKKC